MWDTGTKALLHDEGLLGKMVGRLRQEMKEDRTSSVPTSSPRACPLCVLGLKSTVLPFFATADVFRVSFNHRGAE